MSDIRVDNIKNEAGTGSPGFPYGASITGVATATSFVGNLTGNVTGNASGSSGSCTGNAATATVATNAQGLTGSPNISVGTITASGNVSIGGTLTYEDVTNIDSVGIITARKGINVIAGISTFKGANFNGTNIIKERCNVVAGKLSDNPNIDLETGMVHLFTTADTTTCTPDLRMNASTTLNSVLDVGDTIVVTLMSTAGAAAYSANVTIDTAAVTEKWVGGAAPAAGGAAGIDTYTYTITKLTNTPTWNVIGNVTNAA